MLSKRLFEKVKLLLEQDPKLRESDSVLMARVWYNDLVSMQLDPDAISTTQFLSLLAAKKISSYEAITRGRRKIMEENPHLRGKSYSARKKKEKEVKTEVKDWSNYMI